MENKLKNGEIGVALNEEQIIWRDRKRTILGLPWSFTVYKLTPSRLIVNTGFFNKRMEEIRLYRIKDLSWHQTFGERIVGVGCIHLISCDATLPDFTIKHVKNSQKVKDILSQCIEVSRRENGVRTSELVGGGMPMGGMPFGDGDAPDGASRGPEMFPDFNHDGIDDRQQ